MTLKSAARKMLAPTGRVPAVRSGLRLLSRRGLLPHDFTKYIWPTDTFTVRVDDRASFRYEPAACDVVGRNLFWNDLMRWEAEAWREFVPFARQAKGFLDIGAFTGSYTLAAAAANPLIRCVAFEPVVAVYERLVQNVALNGYANRVKTVNAAVSDASGRANFYVEDRPLPDTGHLDISLRGVEGRAGAWVEVATVAVEDALPVSFEVDLVKIDVEDTEGPVVRGMAEVLRMHRPVVFIEMLATGSHAEATAILAELGYRFFHLLPQGRVAIERPAPVLGDPHMNFLCLPS